MLEVLKLSKFNKGLDKEKPGENIEVDTSRNPWFDTSQETYKDKEEDTTEREKRT